MSGYKAKYNGESFEAKVFQVLQKLSNVNVIRNIPYPSIYSLLLHKHATKMEFRAENIDLTFSTLKHGQLTQITKNFKSLNIECKYQEIPGSVDEKYPLIFQNSQISDAEATLLIYEDPNNSIKKGALEYIRFMALNSSERLIVLSFSEFIQSTNKNYNLNLSDTNLMSGIYDYKKMFLDLGKNKNETFKKALSLNDFKKAFELYQKRQLSLFQFYILYGQKMSMSSGIQADFKGTLRSLVESRNQLTEILSEVDRDLFSFIECHLEDLDDK